MELMKRGMNNEGLEHMADSREAQTQTLESPAVTHKSLFQVVGFAVAVAARAGAATV